MPHPTNPRRPRGTCTRIDTLAFDTYIREWETVLVQFKSRYSRHCKQLAPAYATAATFLEDFGIYLAAVDCQDFSELCDEHGVNSWPTLRVYRGNPEVYEGYEGGRGVEDFITYFNKTCPPEICPTTTTTAGIPPPTPPPNPSPNTTAPNAIWLAEDHSIALLKLHIPGLETTCPLDSPSQPLSILLNFTISPNGHHLVLNSHPLALQVPDPSRPPQILAPRIPANGDLEDYSRLNLFDVDYVATQGGHLITALDYAIYARNRDDPGIRYYNYHPDIYVDVIGAGVPGWPVQTTLMDGVEQKGVKIVLYDSADSRSGLGSDDPNRRYAIESVSFVDRPLNYRAPRPDDRKCSLWSWRCANLGDPPWYQFVWPQNFDRYGRIGCTRRVVLMWKERVEGWLPVPLWVVVVGWGVIGGWRWWRRDGRVGGGKGGKLLIGR